MKETVSGVKVKGEWKDVVNKGEEVAEVLEEEDDEGAQEWEEWRPREGDDFHAENREKTVEKASVKESRLEKEGKSIPAETGEAVKDAEKAVVDAAGGDVREASNRTRNAVTRTAFSIGAAGKKAFRWFESFVYRHVMVRTNPHYFDGKLLSAVIERKDGVIRRKATEEYELSVDVNDKELRDDIVDKVKDE